MSHRTIILTALIAGLSVGMIASIYPPNLTHSSSVDSTADYWRGTVDEKLNHIGSQMASLNNKFDSLCDDVTNMKVKPQRQVD